MSEEVIVSNDELDLSDTVENNELAAIDIEEYIYETHEVFGTAYKGSYTGRIGVIGNKERQDLLVSLMHKATKEKHIERRRRITEIKREYVTSGKELLLHKQVELEDLSKLIEVFTNETIERAEKTKRLLIAKVERALKVNIPRELKATFTKYPQSFVKHPGFLYQSSEFYGGHKIWLRINIPYFFEQFSEMNILQTSEDYVSSKLDKLVEQYYILKNKLSRDEINLATRFDRVKTRLDLLDLGITYYEEYMKLLAERGEE